MNMLALRLKPNQDLKFEIERFAKDNNISAGYIATCVGSLCSVVMRMAGASPDEQDVRTIIGDFEIVSLVGTIATSGAHIHISVSNKEGVVIGGHLKEGSRIMTTAEVVIVYDEDMKFDRALDCDTGFKELSIS